MKHLSIKNLSKSFGDFKAVKEVSLDIERGEFVVFLGPSGCGKSTLLRLVAGLEIADSGSIFLGDKEITNFDSAKRDLAMVFQSYALYPHMSVRKNISYPLVIRKKSPSEINDEVAVVANKLGLSELLERRPKELSGGQRQRVALARAMVRRPQAFLMDEPLSNLDAGLRVQMRAELKHLHKELGTTSLYVTHDQIEAMTLAQRIAVMKDGKILQFDTPRNIYNHPRNIFVAQFVGSPAMNFIEGEYVDGHVVNQFMKLKASGKINEVLSSLNIKSKFMLGFRPEDITISKEAKPGYLPIRVFVTEELGNENFIVMDGGGNSRITARVDSSFTVSDDSQIWFSINEDKAHLFDVTTGVRLEST